MKKTPLDNQYTIPDSSTIRQTAQEIVQGDEYQLDSVSTGDDSYLVELFFRVFYWIGNLFIKFFGLLNGLPEVLRIIIIFCLVVILILILAHIIYTMIIVFRGGKKGKDFLLISTDEKVSPESLENQSREMYDQKDYISAIRFLFLASLIRLEEHEKKIYARGLTNHQHLIHFRGTPVYKSFEKFVQVIDFKWYGEGECHEEDYFSCRDAHLKICSYVQGS